MKEQIHQDIIASDASPSTLTADFADNRTNKIKVERCDEVQLEVEYTPGATTNQYIELFVETSVDGSNWKPFPTMIATTADIQVYDGKITIPGDKISASGAVENHGVSLQLNHIWARFSVREYTNAGGDPSVFGTIHIAGMFKYDVN